MEVLFIFIYGSAAIGCILLAIIFGILVENIINERREKRVENQEPMTLDDMLSKFLKDSDERQLDLKRNIDSKRGYSRKHS